MKRYPLIALLLIALTPTCFAQNAGKRIINPSDYRKSSLYSLLITHEGTQFRDEIDDCFLEIPIPDTYNNHDLSVKMVSMPGQGKNSKVVRATKADIDSFLLKNQVASRLVAQWFLRNSVTGEVSAELIQARGLQAASAADIERAAAGKRGVERALKDGGDSLIQNTFVLVNDISYYDKQKTAKALGAGLRILGAIASAATGDNSYQDLGNTVGSVAETLKGFNVNIHTHLYRLVWNDETSALMNAVAEGRTDFEAVRDQFTLEYMGMQRSSGSTTSFLGIKEDEPERMVRKACQRGIDENIVSLQKNFQPFQIKTPLTSIEPLEARIGMKEGVAPTSRFEVLAEELNEDGAVIGYKKVGELAPVANLIWDNRYMAKDEWADGANLEATTFKRVSGSDFQPGYLIRQIR